MRFTPQDSSEIALAIERIEHKSAAEIVVVVRPRSGEYRDLEIGIGCMGAFLVLLVNLFSPLAVVNWFVPVDVLLAFLIIFWLTKVQYSENFRVRERLPATIFPKDTFIV